MNRFNLVFMLGFYISGAGVWGYNSRSSEYCCFYCLFICLFIYVLFNDDVGSSTNVSSEIWTTSDDFLGKLYKRTGRLVFKYSRSISLKLVKTINEANQCPGRLMHLLC